MSKLADEEHDFLYMMRIVLVSYLKGQPPVLAIEAGRRAIPSHVRPSFAEVEAAYRGEAAKSGGEAEATAQA
jgi:chemotaxis protein MotA